MKVYIYVLIGIIAGLLCAGFFQRTHALKLMEHIDGTSASVVDVGTGINVTLNIRDAGGLADCSITFTNGAATAQTCQ